MKTKEILKQKNAIHEKWEQHQGSDGRVSLLDDGTISYCPSDQNFLDHEEIISVPCFDTNFSYWWKSALKYNEEVIQP